MRRAAALAIAVAVAVALGCVAWQAPVEGAASGEPVAAPRAQSAAVDARQVPEAVPALAKGSMQEPLVPWAPPASLQGTVADGAWRVDAQGRLVVDRALRRRFDYWLTAVGEWSPEAIGARVLDEARRDLPPQGLQELNALWQRYVGLQGHPWQRAVRPADPTSWRPALEERQQVRRQVLGAVAAAAFYGDEEQLLWRQVLAFEAGAAVPQAEPPAPPEHPQAAARVAAVEAAWAHWEERLAQARDMQARLRAAPELSDAQREQAAQAWLAAHFTPAELPRVRALAGLAPGAGD